MSDSKSIKETQRIIAEHLSKSQSPGGFTPGEMKNPKLPTITYPPPANARGSEQLRK